MSARKRRCSARVANGQALAPCKTAPGARIKAQAALLHAVRHRRLRSLCRFMAGT